MSDNEESTALEIEQDDDNIEKIHERKTLLGEGRKRVKSPSCKTMLCKAVVVSIAGILFILMMVELWGDYGNIIESKTIFYPRIYSITEVCPEENVKGQLTKEYNRMNCKMNVNETGSFIHCDSSMPTNPMVLPSSHPGKNTIVTSPDSLCVNWDGVNISTCVRLLIWSI
jgi:hypothetical protein